MTTTCLTAITSHGPDLRLRDLRDALEDAFGCDFHVFDAETGAAIHVARSLPRCEQAGQAEILSAAARTAQPQFLADEDAVVLFALPLMQAWNLPWVAVAPFATRAVGNENLAAPARLLQLDEQQAPEWINAQAHWQPHSLERVGREFLRRLRDQRRIGQLERELEKVSSSLASSYEEISLLHSISQNFRLSSTDEELGNLALEWLQDCIATQGVALVYLPVARPNESTYHARTEPLMLSCGKCPVGTAPELLDLVERLQPAGQSRTLVINQGPSELSAKLPSDIRQLVLTPMLEGERVFGYLLAFNHSAGREFGTVEANLLASVSSMLGVHCSNRDLYRQQDEILASVVRALTSAIDAKDPYTRGHSGRVARVSARLAKELGCDNEFLSTIYMAGLLHDIGKIGIDDAVLRKPGKLTDAEFEHIKQHPALGYKILADIKQFAPVLPAVLHHHEQIDGSGYPCRLNGEQIPFIARIVAVADAYDAMISDRPYRPGMPPKRVQKVFQEGAGKQWDAAVVAAFFAIYDELATLLEKDHPSRSLDVETWLV
jgi:HD-GYP domain-containing protein (c-di-GMP phosphodiesterase class II)